MPSGLMLGSEPAAKNVGSVPDAMPPTTSRQIGECLTLGVVIPALVIGGGGHRKILRFCRDWALSGHRITLYVNTTDAPERVHHEIRQHFFDFDFEVQIFRGFVTDHDAIICTHWSTAYDLRNLKSPDRVFYFVQDFEPMFYPASTNFAKALATYQMGFNVVPFGKWVNDRLCNEIGITTYPVDFTVDTDRYRRMNLQRVVDVLFFARPSQPRRCFELGVEALRILYKINPTVKVALYGENEYGNLGFLHHNFGLIKNLDDLVLIYNQCRLGICFSTTNPSSVGYEMLSCGMALLDIKVPGWTRNFGGDEFVYYAQPTAESIAIQIAKALDDREKMAGRVEKGVAFVRSMPDDGQIARQMMGYIRTALE